MLRDVLFDGLIGPTHNYAGLSSGNVASTSHGGQTSHPKKAALQGLAKMRFVLDLGIDQALLPPLERPDVDALRSLGFTGDDDTIITRAAREAPDLLARVTSASSMWTANAATIAPSCDTLDHAVHVTPANLIAKKHRALEPPQTASMLRLALPFATHHPPLPADRRFGDEGAANHTRLHTPEGTVHLFVYGTDPDDPAAPKPTQFDARQSRTASATIAGNHQLPDAMVLLAQQHPSLIDAGVFHNDVISVGGGNLLLLHEAAWVDTPDVLSRLTSTLGPMFTPLLVTHDMLSVQDAIDTYLFNSQLLHLHNGSFALLCPTEVHTHPAAVAVTEAWLTDDTPISQVHFMDLRESMHNGGGPACLRLRVPLSPDEVQQVHPGLRLSHERLADLEQWVQSTYPETLTPQDLADPALLKTSRDALDQLTRLLGLGNCYPFQQ
jgi:succinylarginine dihydrolase